MRNISRKLVLSIIAVVLTVFALGSTTFAWFTLTNTSTVQAFEAQIIGDSGIEISLGAHGTTFANPDAAEWVTTLTTADVEAYLVDTYGNTQIFNHVTTADGISFSTLGATAMTATTAGFIELPLNFRSDTATSINWTTVSLTAAGNSWTVDADFTDATDTARVAGDSITVDASDAMRIAMVSNATYGGNTVAYEKPSSGTNVVLGTGGDLSDSANAGHGVAGAMNYYYSKNNALPFGAAAVTTLSTITDLAAGQPVVSLVDVSGSATDFGADNYGQLTVRIWLEGWDANAYNSILSQLVSTSFTFQGIA
jgi:hypothetical protein